MGYEGTNLVVFDKEAQEACRVWVPDELYEIVDEEEEEVEPIEGAEIYPRDVVVEWIPWEEAKAVFREKRNRRVARFEDAWPEADWEEEEWLDEEEQ